MNNPFEQSAPENVIERVHDFARDLAYGATRGLWHTKIQWQQILKTDISKHSLIFAENLRPKWGTELPSEYLLLSFGYLEELGHQAGFSTYLLTDKAFALLEKPIAPLSIFISYRRSESSALGLLIEARLKLAGNPNPFIDKNLVAGEKWSAELKKQVEQSRYFVCLLGKTTLESAYVRQELAWAEAAACTIISVLHGYHIDENTPTVLQDRHAITVQEESALGYEMAVNQLLNSLGYATY